MREWGLCMRTRSESSDESDESDSSHESHAHLQVSSVFAKQSIVAAKM